MTRQSCMLLISSSLLCALLCADLANANSSVTSACKPRPKFEREEKLKTVVDYLLEVPADLLGWNNSSGKPFTIQERLNRIRICDETNGFLELDNSQLDGDWVPTVAYFKRGKLAPLLAFGFQNSNLVFLEKSPRGWVNVTSRVMPPHINDAFINDAIRRKSAAARKLGPDYRFTDNASEPALIYELPRKGRFIRAIGGNGGPGIAGTELFRLQLKGEVFEVVP